MPFLPPNQQRQSTEGTKVGLTKKVKNCKNNAKIVQRKIGLSTADMFLLLVLFLKKKGF